MVRHFVAAGPLNQIELARQSAPLFRVFAIISGFDQRVGDNTLHLNQTTRRAVPKKKPRTRVRGLELFDEQ